MVFHYNYVNIDYNFPHLVEFYFHSSQMIEFDVIEFN